MNRCYLKKAFAFSIIAIGTFALLYAGNEKVLPSFLSQKYNDAIQKKKLKKEYSQSIVGFGDSSTIIEPNIRTFEQEKKTSLRTTSKELAFEFSGLSSNIKVYNADNKDGSLKYGGQNLKFAWLMSFPNSGTSYTLKMISRISERTTATNYGKEHEDTSGNSFVFGPKYTHGPFRSYEDYPIPDGYILTKTHCGSRCTSCHPNRYVETEWSFLQECLSGHREIHFDDEVFIEKKAYSQDYIKRAVHLIRDPFDNIVSRFHLNWNHKSKLQDHQWLESHPRNAEGFQKWCQDADLEYVLEEKAMHYRNIPNFYDIPCRAEFFKYIQWHNRAFQVIEKMDIPELVIHYEDYKESFNQTISTIASFLELEVVGEAPEYFWSDYSAYYSESQHEYIVNMIQSLSTKTTWNKLAERYNF